MKDIYTPAIFELPDHQSHAESMGIAHPIIITAIANYPKVRGEVFAACVLSEPEYKYMVSGYNRTHAAAWLIDRNTNSDPDGVFCRPMPVQTAELPLDILANDPRFVVAATLDEAISQSIAASERFQQERR